MSSMPCLELPGVCHFTAAALPGFNLALCAKAIYVDLCKFYAKMNDFQSKWVFFQRLEKLICGIDGRKSTSSEMGRWERFTEMPLNHELFVCLIQVCMRWQDFCKKLCEAMKSFKILNYVWFKGSP